MPQERRRPDDLVRRTFAAVLGNLHASHPDEPVRCAVMLVATERGVMVEHLAHDYVNTDAVAQASQHLAAILGEAVKPAIPSHLPQDL